MSHEGTFYRITLPKTPKILEQVSSNSEGNCQQWKANKIITDDNRDLHHTFSLHPHHFQKFMFCLTERFPMAAPGN